MVIEPAIKSLRWVSSNSPLPFFDVFIGSRTTQKYILQDKLTRNHYSHSHHIIPQGNWLCWNLWCPTHT
jgi:hypothetical protein